MTIKETKNAKNLATVEVTVSTKEITAQKDHAIAELSSQVTVKGFRRGKAPKNVAEKHLDAQKVTDHVLSHLLQEAVNKILTEKKYKLIGRPVLQDVNTKGKEGWVLTLDFPLYPKVTLSDYKKLISKANKASAPKKAKKSKKDEGATQKDQEEKVNKIYQVLLDSTKLEIPQSVIDEEVNYSLQRLQSQAQQLNLTQEQYLQAIKKTLDQVKEEYAKNATESIKLDLILLAIAQKEKITVPESEVVALAKSANLSDNQHSRIRSVLERRKTVEYLSSL